MAITFNKNQNDSSFVTPEQKKQKKLLVILALIVLAIAAVIYFGYFGSSSSAPLAGINQPTTGQTVNPSGIEGLMAAVKTLKIENPVYQDKHFTELLVHGNLPVAPGQKGRENPFAPF